MTAPRARRTKAPAVQPATVELPDEPTDEGEAGAGEPGNSPAPDLDPIFPDHTQLTVMGIPATVRRFQTREIMAGIRILVSQLGTGITQIDLDTPFEEQKNTILGLVLVTLPDAGDEVLTLLASLVRAKNPKQQEDLDAIMYNPPPTVTIDVIGVVFEQEREDFSALVGKVRTLLGYAQALQRTGKTGT